MVVHDLRGPLMLAPRVIETAESPLVLLQRLGDRANTVMLMHKPDLGPDSLRFSFCWYRPEDGSFGFACADMAQEAYELAQAQYQRETHPLSGSTQ